MGHITRARTGDVDLTGGHRLVKGDHPGGQAQPRPRRRFDDVGRPVCRGPRCTARRRRGGTRTSTGGTGAICGKVRAVRRTAVATAGPRGRRHVVVRGSNRRPPPPRRDTPPGRLPASSDAGPFDPPLGRRRERQTAMSAAGTTTVAEQEGQDDAHTPRDDRRPVAIGAVDLDDDSTASAAYTTRMMDPTTTAVMRTTHPATTIHRPAVTPANIIVAPAPGVARGGDFDGDHREPERPGVVVRWQRHGVDEPIPAAPTARVGEHHRRDRSARRWLSRHGRYCGGYG